MHGGRFSTLKTQTQRETNKKKIMCFK